MLKITASTAEAFSDIEAALTEFDESEVFLRYFDSAIQSEADVEGITVILRNNKKFKKDLNKKKYVINIPTSLKIDAFEFIKKYEGRNGKRIPFYSVLVKGHLEVSSVNIVLMLVGFNDDAVRIVSFDEEPIENPSDGGDVKHPVACPMAPKNNRDMYRLYHPPMPLGPMDHCHNHLMPPPPPHDHHMHDHCPMPMMNCDEEEFVLDTLEQE